jgi:hypothetical protein
MYVPTEFQIKIFENKEKVHLFLTSPIIAQQKHYMLEDRHIWQSNKFHRIMLKNRKVKRKNRGHRHPGRIFRKVQPHLKCGHSGLRQIGVSEQV